MMVAMADETTARAEMVRRLKRTGAVGTSAVEQAMLQVPRHRFVPQIEGCAAYIDEAVMVKHTGGGVPISSLSQPTIVAIMLERLEVSSGHRVLEVGTGTGYNAALLSVLTGVTGYVASIELEPDLAERAARTLASAGYDRVDVLLGDGSEGYPARAPYDRVIVTSGARSVAEAWIAQLAAGGRMVVPIVDRRGRGLIVTFEECGGELVHSAGAPCGFVPLRHSPAGG
jgi:protein-L-isoaspartate(D-aspartate) O-methyltransferase